MRLRVIPQRDLVLPPVSSKLVKSLLVKPHVPRWLRELVEAQQSYKPLFVSMLYRGSHPLYSTTGSPAPLTVRAGEQLEARVAFMTRDVSAVREATIILSERAETPYGPVEVIVEEASVMEPGQLRLPSPSGSPTGVLRLRARTPIVLTSKTLLARKPPPPARIPKLHRLLPTPGLLAAYALRLWNRALGPDYTIYWRDAWNYDAAMIARAAEIYMGELDYHVRPETVIIGKDRAGRLRLVRAWKGWITYRVASLRLTRLLDKLLALTSTLGLGRSRGIGLGDIRAEWICQH